jgi:hypothetical protein
MQIVPLDAVLHFDLHAAILGWLLTAAQTKLQHSRHPHGFGEKDGGFEKKVADFRKKWRI